MYHPQPIPSSSHTTTSDSDSGTPRYFFAFPTSNIRSSPLARPRKTASPLTRSPQSTTSTTTAHSDHLYTSKYEIPTRREIEPGVWSDGKDLVFSAAHPAVQEFLASARRTLSLPVPPSELIFALAALEVFYSWRDPVHWMFWSDEKKAATAAVVNRIALRTPQVIRSKVAWNGEAEYLFILSGLHGASSLPVDQEWFHILNPAKAASAPMNLRKRKIQQTDHIDQGEDEASEIEDPRPKRAKTRSARVVKPPNTVTPENAKPHTPKSASSEASSSSYRISLPSQNDDDPSLLVKSKTSRHKTSPTPDPLSVPRADSASPGAAETPDIPSYTRNRSGSQTSSQTTLVAVGRRSVSVLSNSTAVETPTSDKEVAKDVHESEEEKEGMVTRGRANRVRATFVQGKGESRPTKPRARRRVAN
ncbi:hypothetical protein H0H92_009952 [Tricholoma furcatifolium]|nr:hypothetical protein H0H92_009952 [Tricholoma furcatifolium]